MDYVAKLFKRTPFFIGMSIFVIGLAYQGGYIFVRYAGSIPDPDKIISISFVTLYTVLFFLVIPLLINKFILKENLKNLGLMIPEKKIRALVLTLLGLLILMPPILHLAKRPEFQAFYSFGKISLGASVFMQLVDFPIYYFSEEFFFRGFLFITLWKRVGWHSFWITDIIFTLAHLTKPPLELLLSIFASVVFNILTLNTKSIYPALVVHYCMGIALVISVNYFS